MVQEDIKTARLIKSQNQITKATAGPKFRLGCVGFSHLSIHDSSIHFYGDLFL